MGKTFKIIGLVIILAAIVAAVFYIVSGKKEGAETAPAPVPALVAPTSQAYKNDNYGFEFTYPLVLAQATPVYGDLADQIVQVEIPQGTYPGTNFGDAAFAVSAVPATSLASCLQLFPPENGDGFKTKTAIGGIDFYQTNSTGAAAGNIYRSTVYRAFIRNTTCLELSEVIHTSNIGNYPPGAVTEVDTAPIQEQLDAIRESFRLTR